MTVTEKIASAIAELNEKGAKAIDSHLPLWKLEDGVTVSFDASLAPPVPECSSCTSLNVIVSARVEGQLQGLLLTDRLLLEETNSADMDACINRLMRSFTCGLVAGVGKKYGINQKSDQQVA